MKSLKIFVQSKYTIKIQSNHKYFLEPNFFLIFSFIQSQSGLWESMAAIFGQSCGYVKLCIYIQLTKIVEGKLTKVACTVTFYS